MPRSAQVSWTYCSTARIRTTDSARSRGGSRPAMLPPWQNTATPRVSPRAGRKSREASRTGPDLTDRSTRVVDRPSVPVRCAGSVFPWGLPAAAAQRRARPVADIAGLEQRPADPGRPVALLQPPADPPEQAGAERNEDGEDEPHAQPAGEEEPHGPDTAPTRRPGTASGVVGRQSDDHLAGVTAAQEVEERGHGVFEPLAHGLADDELAGGQPAGDGLQELRPQVAVVTDEETLQPQAVGDQQRQVTGTRGRLDGVVGRDRSADRRAPVQSQRPHRRLEMVPADVVEVDVDAIGRRCRQQLGHRPGVVVEGGVEPELAGEPPHLLRAPGAADDPAGPAEPGELADQAADGAGGTRDEDVLARLEGGHAEQPGPGGETRHPQ